MVKPPFDTPESHARIIDRLTDVGVAVQGASLRGFPWFPLATLEDPKALAELRTILDQLVDESQMASPTALAGPDDVTAIQDDAPPPALDR